MLDMRIQEQYDCKFQKTNLLPTLTVLLRAGLRARSEWYVWYHQSCSQGYKSKLWWHWNQIIKRDSNNRKLETTQKKKKKKNGNSNHSPHIPPRGWHFASSTCDSPWSPSWAPLMLSWRHGDSGPSKPVRGEDGGKEWDEEMWSSCKHPKTHPPLFRGARERAGQPSWITNAIRSAWSLNVSNPISYIISSFLSIFLIFYLFFRILSAFLSPVFSNIYYDNDGLPSNAKTLFNEI